MKEIFPIDKEGPFKAKVDERFHKLGLDCPEDGWVHGYLTRDLYRGEVLPHIFNCPCWWIVQEETIEPVGFYIAQWIKVEDRLPEREEGFVTSKVVLVRHCDGSYNIAFYSYRENDNCWFNPMICELINITH